MAFSAKLDCGRSCVGVWSLRGGWPGFCDKSCSLFWGVCLLATKHHNQVVATQTFHIFTPKIGEDEPILTKIFSNGVVQPPTRQCLGVYHPFKGGFINDDTIHLHCNVFIWWTWTAQTLLTDWLGKPWNNFQLGGSLWTSPKKRRSSSWFFGSVFFLISLGSIPPNPGRLWRQMKV